jgi:DEAD/DEAH box helicase domain-containing protein
MAGSDAFRPVIAPLRTTELIRDRAVEAVLGQSGINHAGLAAEIRRRFGASDVASGALVREPVIEGAAPFEIDGRTFADCSGSLLHTKVIEAISSDMAGEYCFPPDAQPYRHQIAAWEHLTSDERRSVLVSSGTGSGKTECFLMPLLHDLATEADATGRLSGVRALALYPLNALIASQEERLKAWTAPFGGTIRFGLYNGLTPERLRAQDKPGPEQVGDRGTLRADPPPILVTNVTMLEYLTVRRIDRPLIANSRGTLRWIILDEAHSYVGSSAAEIALLIRRVLLTFGVKAEDVRFVATSATIGGGEDVTDELRRFLRDLSGVDERKVQIVLGKRENIVLPAAAPSSVLGPTMLRNRDAVAASPAVQVFVRAVECGALSLAEAEAILRPTGAPIDAVIGAIAAGDEQRGPLLPLRIHNFLRAVPGVWSCLDPSCGGSPADWPFGAIVVERVDVCPHCTAPVLEVMVCRECGEPYLDCEERDGFLRPRITPPTIDEFAGAREPDENAGDNDEARDCANEIGYDPVRRAVATRVLPHCGRAAYLEPKTGRRHDSLRDGSSLFQAHEPEDCGACRAKAGKVGPVLRPLRYGAPFLIGNAAPVLLEGVPRRIEGKPAYLPPAEGRQLLSFTDSRQGTARFAASLQTNAERGYVRGFLYHAAQSSMVTAEEDDAKVMALRAEIETLSSFAATAPQVADLVAIKEADLAAKLAPSTKGIAWTDMRDRMAQTPEISHWIMKVWGPRETDRYLNNPSALTEFLLLREFNRRPRRGNTAETMGLARLRFDAVDRATNIPEPLTSRGFGTAAWQGLLYSIIDMSVRARFAFRANWDDMHWINTPAPLAKLLPPGEKSEARTDLGWPAALKGQTSNLVLILEKSLCLDHNDAQDRARLNLVLQSAWSQLLPLFSSAGQPGYALDFTKAWIAPVIDAWRCPVTRRVLPATALGFTPYGHRDGLTTSNVAPQPVVFPHLAVTFPRGNAVERIHDWLASDPLIASLREQGLWANLHDRVALLSPYLRAAEHSAQQPPARLRRFEREFKAGEINILNCSTTMEMGVDIGSVSAVMMTNVPPSLANYRQRVGRAGRRRQGFAASLTYTRDTPLDREAFRDPKSYLARITRAPKVKLDSRRIVQRHVNALLLARWFAGAGGEAMKTRAGDFFGCAQDVGTARLADAPVAICAAWILAPDTIEVLSPEIEQLTRGTVLAGDQTLFEAASRTLVAAETGFVSEWKAMQAQAVSAPTEAKAGLEYQLKVMVRESLLKELAVRGVLPGHGFPTAVVPFINDNTPSRDDQAEGEGASHRRRSFPTRNLDIAIRDYAPGAQVVVDGLVYRSAGVTLSWLRPDSADLKDVQNIRTFWTCPKCGAADCGHTVPEHCPACRADIPLMARRRFLEPSGFTADMAEKPHADTDDVTFVEPEPEQIVARGAAWQPFADPALGRMRSSSDGLVFYSSRGPSKKGYNLCLECGRAAPAGDADTAAMVGHAPLRGTKRNSAGLCPGNDKPFKIMRQIALGHETMTDVVEIEPANLSNPGTAWATVSALRESLSRRLGIETGELGMAIRPASTALGQRTHSLLLFDRASGGAGFAPQAMELFETLLADMLSILDCKEKGCRTGCSACVLTADLYKQQETIDRKGALAWVESARAAFDQLPTEDQATPDARYSRSVADELALSLDAAPRTVTIWADPALDVAQLSAGRFDRLARRIADRGATLRLVVDPKWLDALDPAARLALRDAAKVRPFSLDKGQPPRFANGASAIAAIEGGAPRLWLSRDPAAWVIGPGWGHADTAPVVRILAANIPLSAPVELDSLLPASGTRFLELSDEMDGPIIGFGKRLVARLLPAIRETGCPGALVRIDYNDRYLQSPLVLRLMVEALAEIRDNLASPNATIPVSIVSNRFKPNDRQPFAPEHDWQWEEDRREVLLALVQTRGMLPSFSELGAGHGRVITLHFEGGARIRIILDQGFGPWRTPRSARFDFGEDAAHQGRAIAAYSALIAAQGTSYAVVTRS